MGLDFAAKPARAATLGRTPPRVHDRRVPDRCRLTDRITRGFRAMSPADPKSARRLPPPTRESRFHKKINGTRATMTTRACFVLAAVAAVCPDYQTRPYCSGHGDCSLSGRCECWDGWVGGSCAERTCPAGRAWADIATATDTAHAAGAEWHLEPRQRVSVRRVRVATPRTRHLWRADGEQRADNGAAHGARGLRFHLPLLV